MSMSFSMKILWILCLGESIDDTRSIINFWYRIFYAGLNIMCALKECYVKNRTIHIKKTQKMP